MEAAMTYSTYYRSMAGGTEKNYENINRMGIPACIRSEHLTNASLERDRYINLLGL
jgi:hypothetical protein